MSFHNFLAIYSMQWVMSSDFKPFLPPNLHLQPGVYLVGGSVRDILLNRPPVDYDMVVMENPRGYAAALAKRHAAGIVKLGRGEQVVYRIMLNHATIDVAPPQGPTIEADLRKRDFTINALAYDIQEDRLMDITGGMPDLKSKTIRMVSPDGFLKDSVRLLRAFRMGAALKFRIDSQTVEAIGQRSREIRNCAGERIRDELYKLFLTGDSAEYLEQMAETGLLFEIFPELTATRRCHQNEYHEFTVFEHTLRAYRCLEEIMRTPEVYWGQWGEKLTRYMNGEGRVLLKMALLLHDIGKPSTKQIMEDGAVHFFGHEGKGAEMVKAVGQRLRLSNRAAETLRFIVRHHLRPLHMLAAKKSGQLTPRARARFCRKCGDFTPAILLHAMADAGGKQQTSGWETDPLSVFAAQLMRDFFDNHMQRVSQPALVTGKDLIDVFKLKPSPLFGKLLSRVELGRLAGEIHTRQEALDAVEAHLSQIQKSKKR